MQQKAVSNGWLSFAALGALVFLLLFSENQLEEANKKALSVSLQTVLDTTRDALRVWAGQHRTNANSLAQLPDVREAAQALLTASTETQRQSLRVRMRSYLGPLISSYGYLGFAIIDTRGIRIGSLRTDNNGPVNFISRTVPDVFQKVLEGQPAITLPLKSDVSFVDLSGQERAEAVTMFALAPLRDLEGNILGALALRINPLQEFSGIFMRGRMGLSGETYAFNEDGIMLSESLFTDQLHAIGLLSVNKTSTLNIALRDPGKNLLEDPGYYGRQTWPLTRMATNATAGKAGMSLEPYPDYRGVPVVGAWLWDEVLGFGIATEMDADEAYASLDTSKYAVRLFAAVVILLLIVILMLQQKSAKMAEQKKAELLVEKEKAEEANRAKMEFLTAMSHDMRTPLNTMVGFAQLLHAGLAKEEDEKKYLEFIVRSGQHLHNLLNEVMEFAKLDIGELRLAISSCSSKELVEEAMSMVEALSKTDGISLYVDSDLSSLPPVRADRTRACQVLVNLLTNAIKYNRVEGQVHITVNFEGDHLQFAVRDTGRGIPRDQMKSLWEPFNRLGAESTAIEGSGIGLALAKAIVEGMNGRIGAESTEGVGSCFWFTLPIAGGDEEVEEAVAGVPEALQGEETRQDAAQGKVS